MLVALFPRVTAIIALVGTIPAGALRFTPALLRLCIVLSRNICSPWFEDVVIALVSTAPTNLSGPPAMHIYKRSTTILAMDPALTGEQSALVDVRTSLARLVIVSVDS